MEIRVTIKFDVPLDKELKTDYIGHLIYGYSAYKYVKDVLLKDFKYDFWVDNVEVIGSDNDIEQE